MNTIQAEYKKLSLQYRKNGNAYVDYSIVDKEGNWKSVSPRQWVRLNLPDKTSEYQEKECYTLLVNQLRDRTSFGMFLDIVNNAKKNGISFHDDKKAFYLFAIK